MFPWPRTSDRTPERLYSEEVNTVVPGNGRASLAIDIPVTIAEHGPYTVHCMLDGTPGHRSSGWTLHEHAWSAWSETVGRLWFGRPVLETWRAGSVSIVGLYRK